MSDATAMKLRRCTWFINAFLDELLVLPEFEAPFTHTSLGDAGMCVDQNYWVVRISYSMLDREEGYELWRPEVIYDPEWTNEQAVDQLLTWLPGKRTKIVRKLKAARLWRSQ